jgi:hypothetical protein
MPYFVALIFLLISGCGGNLDYFETPTVTVNISPRFPQPMSRNNELLFQGSETTTIGNSTTINLNSNNFTWSIQEGASGGTLTAVAGNQSYYRYTAPSTPGTYHITITSTKDSTKTDTAIVVVN